MASAIDDIIKLFVVSERRERMHGFAANPKRRSDLIDGMLHDRRALDPRALTELPSTSTPATVRAMLTKPRGKGIAHVISDIAEVDGRDLPLDEALTAVMGRQRDTLVFALETQHAYYENHEGEQFLLKPTKR